MKPRHLRVERWHENKCFYLFNLHLKKKKGNEHAHVNTCKIHALHVKNDSYQKKNHLIVHKKIHEKFTVY